MPNPRARTRTWLIVAVAAAVVLVVATTAAAVMTLDGGHHNAPAGQATGSRSGSSSAGTPWAWMQGGRLHDEADYLSRMVAHHRKPWTPPSSSTRSDRPQMRAFGADIVRTQSAQIEQMNAWLERWYPEQPADTGYRPMMRNLSDLSGAALDRAFLRDMTIHHMAAVMMSQQLLAHGLATHPAGGASWHAPSATSSTPRSSGCSGGSTPGTARAGTAATARRGATVTAG